MNNWPIQIIYDLPIISVVLLMLLSIAILVIKKLQNESEEFKKQLFQLQNEFRAMSSGHLGMGRELNKMCADMASVENIQTQNQQQSTPAKTYEQAGLLLSRGASIEEVVDSCEIAPAEAELLAIMRHSAPRSSASQHKVN